MRPKRIIDEHPLRVALEECRRGTDEWFAARDRLVKEQGEGPFFCPSSLMQSDERMAADPLLSALASPPSSVAAEGHGLPRVSRALLLGGETGRDVATLVAVSALAWQHGGWPAVAAYVGLAVAVSALTARWLLPPSAGSGA